MLDFYVIPALYLGAFQQATWIIRASFSPLGKKKKKQTQNYSVPYQQMSNEKWFINAHCSAPASRVKGSPETQTSLFL